MTASCGTGRRRTVGAELKACPFCEETDFDLIGLKLHLIRWCQVYAETDAIAALQRELHGTPAEGE